MFQPRPQVKRPRACADCQKRRQRENEKAWHSRNKDHFSPLYHQIKKRLRLREIRKIFNELARCFRAGMTFYGKQIEFPLFEEGLLKFFIQLGIRRINKFCTVH